MELPTYITVDEVKRICRELGIRDWTTLSKAEVLPEEAALIQESVGSEAAMIPAAEFLQGLEVELEHGLQFPDANVTNNHPLLTGKIVLAHLKETLDYYARLEVAELEGDLLKAITAGNADKIKSVYKKLIAARLHLGQKEADQLV